MTLIKMNCPQEMPQTFSPKSDAAIFPRAAMWAVIRAWQRRTRTEEMIAVLDALDNGKRRPPEDHHKRGELVFRLDGNHYTVREADLYERITKPCRGA